MTDRPELPELFDAVRMHIETQILPLTRPEPRLYFQTLVALNLLRIGQRELTAGTERYHAEWQSINELMSEGTAAPESEAALISTLKARRHELCREIRAGKYDSTVAAGALMRHLEVTVFAELALNNPALAARMASEVAS